MDPDLVGPARLGLELHERVFSPLANDFVACECVTQLPLCLRLRATETEVLSRATNREFYAAAFLFRRAVDHREICFTDIAVMKCFSEEIVGYLVFSEDEYARGIAVEPVHIAADGRRILRFKPLLSGFFFSPAVRVRDEAGRFGNGDQVSVFVEDGQFHLSKVTYFPLRRSRVANSARIESKSFSEKSGHLVSIKKSSM